jgi:nitrile hydratase accessory protein
MTAQDAPFMPKDRDGPVFSAPWEARSFALLVLMHKQGGFSWKTWVEKLSAQIAQSEHGEHARQGHADDYYACWLAAMESLLKETGVITDESLAQSIARTLVTWPHPDHTAQRTPVALHPAIG